MKIALVTFYFIYNSGQMGQASFSEEIWPRINFHIRVKVWSSRWKPSDCFHRLTLQQVHSQSKFSLKVFIYLIQVSAWRSRGFWSRVFKAVESFTQQATICLFIKRGNAKQDKGWEEGHGGGEEKVSVNPDKIYTFIHICI